MRRICDGLTHGEGPRTRANGVGDVESRVVDGLQDVRSYGDSVVDRDGHPDPTLRTDNWRGVRPVTFVRETSPPLDRVREVCGWAVVVTSSDPP